MSIINTTPKDVAFADRVARILVAAIEERVRSHPFYNPSKGSDSQYIGILHVLANRGLSRGVLFTIVKGALAPHFPEMVISKDEHAIKLNNEYGIEIVSARVINIGKHIDAIIAEKQLERRVRQERNELRKSASAKLTPAERMAVGL